MVRQFANEFIIIRFYPFIVSFWRCGASAIHKFGLKMWCYSLTSDCYKALPVQITYRYKPIICRCIVIRVALLENPSARPDQSNTECIAHTWAFVSVIIKHLFYFIDFCSVPFLELHHLLTLLLGPICKLDQVHFQGVFLLLFYFTFFVFSRKWSYAHSIYLLVTGLVIISNWFSPKFYSVIGSFSSWL